MASVEIKAVRKAYGAAEIIHGVTIEIRDGEFLAVVGPSGCGKSTLLRMIAGLEDITSGTISIGGRVVNDLAPKERNIAMVFQNYALYPHMTVAENMAFSLKLARVGRAEMTRKVNAAAGVLGLEHLLGRYPGQLSGGQRQRVAMGRAIVRDPQVFLFDEPLSNLDAKLRVQMRAEIRELHERLKTTTIYVTHDQIEAMTMADRIVIMRDGVIEQIGAPLDIYDNPENLFVAGFIGNPAMNFVEGTVTSGIVRGPGDIRIALPPRHAAFEGRSVTCGIRPDRIHLGDTGVPADVIAVEPTGAETQIVAKSGGHVFTLALHERTTARAGDRIHLRIDPEDVTLFDTASGARLTPHTTPSPPQADYIHARSDI